MVSDNLKHATQIVNDIVNLNDSRRELDTTSTTEALLQVETSGQLKNFSTVVYGPDWNKGVIGIVASRLTESYYKPTVVFTNGNDGELVASARSVSDFDVHHALETCSDLFLKFGGHPAAARGNHRPFRLWQKLLQILSIKCEFKYCLVWRCFFNCSRISTSSYMA